MRPLQRLLVTGGAGFIGSAFVRTLLNIPDFNGFVLTLDSLTYASDLSLLENLDEKRHRFVRGDILDQSLVKQLLREEEIDTIVHFAAQTHVDRSIVSAAPFFETNVNGTLALLEALRAVSKKIHFHHVSTDEVYGSLGRTGLFNESSPYKPNSPYAASKAGSDLLVRAFAHTYDLSTTISHCSNNYGPGQHPEKFIPLMTLHALNKKPLPLYGTGGNIRDWLYVDDHANALWRILKIGKKSETYDLGGNCELTNFELLKTLLRIIAEETQESLDDLISLITFVPDRLGHDFRYAIDSSKSHKELGWAPETRLLDGLRKTVCWYLNKAVVF